MNQKRFTVFLCLKVNTAYRKSVHKYKKVLDKTLPGLHCTALLCIVKLNRKYTNEYEFKKTYEIKKKSDRDMA